MNINKIIILGIILTILTVGAVDAVEDTSDDNDNKLENVESISDDAKESVADDGYLSKNIKESDMEVLKETTTEYDDKNNSEELRLGDDENVNKSEQTLKSDDKKSENNDHHYGYWLNSIDMFDVNLTDMSEHGVTDLFLSYYAYTRYNQSTVESFLASAKAEDINVHIWTQIFYEGTWVKPLNDGVINQEFFDEKIKELEIYANTPGVAGIHLDYIRYSGSDFDDNSEDYTERMEAVSEFVRQATRRLREVNPDIILSAALMPNYEYLETYYGDDIGVISENMDVIIPMVYVGNFRGNATWVEETTQWYVNQSRGAEVWTGLQGYTVNDINEVYISKLPHSQMSMEIKSSLKGGSNGAIVFRYGVCDNIDYVNLPIDEYEFSTFNNLDYVISCSKELAILNQDFAFNPDHDTEYVNGIRIVRDNLTIDGNNHVIDGGNLARLFNITGKNITFKNIVFVNANADNGGALYLRGDDVKIINCTFIGNNATTDGGAVYINAENATVVKSTFINNTAPYNGAIYINSGNGKVIDSYFENNVADISAGAIGWSNNENGLIDNCTFINNSAYVEGGGAVFWNEGSNGKITNSKFYNNYGNLEAGAIFWGYGDDGIISNCLFANNNANVSGGAIVLEGENMTIKDCNFNNNTADNGGAINILICSCDLINSTLINNTATYGGAINDNGRLVVNNSKFITNKAEDGGAIYSNNTIAILYNSILINNTDNTFNKETLTYNCSIIEAKDSEPKKISPKIPKNHVQTHKITRSKDKITQPKIHTIKLANDNTLVYTGKVLTLDALNRMFDLNFTNGHLLVYIDGVLVFNNTTSDDITMTIIELLDKYFGVHEIKVVFTDNQNKTNTYTENIIIG